MVITVRVQNVTIILITRAVYPASILGKNKQEAKGFSSQPIVVFLRHQCIPLIAIPSRCCHSIRVMEATPLKLRSSINPIKSSRVMFTIPLRSRQCLLGSSSIKRHTITANMTKICFNSTPLSHLNNQATLSSNLKS